MKARIALASLITVVTLSLLVGSFSVGPRPAVASPAGVHGGRALPGDAIAVEGIVKDGDRTLLRIRNRTPFVLMVYVGGVRVGWMRPYRVGLMRGLVTGYHQMYAHSRYGTTSWGPRAVWVPGTWNLLY